MSENPPKMTHSLCSAGAIAWLPNSFLGRWFGLVWFGLVELAWKVLAGAFSTTDTSLCVFGFCHGLRITKSRVFTTKCDGLQTAGKQWPFLSHRGTGQDKASACAGRTRPGLMTFQMSNMTKTRTHQSMHAMHNVHAT
jgi:hypothetical protein